jgi:hypothetical protein
MAPRQVRPARDEGRSVIAHGGSPTSGLRKALPWIVLGLGLALATAPVWRLLLLGFNPTLDELLQIRCFTQP